MVILNISLLVNLKAVELGIVIVLLFLIKKFVSKELLDDAENWNDNNSTITEEMIAEAITMSGISMSADGDFTVYYDDGDIFSGHSIVVTGNMGKGLFEANME